MRDRESMREKERKEILGVKMKNYADFINFLETKIKEFPNWEFKYVQIAWLMNLSDCDKAQEIFEIWKNTFIDFYKLIEKMYLEQK